MFKKPLFLPESSTLVRFSILSLGQVQSFLDYVSFNLLPQTYEHCQVIAVVFRLKFPRVSLMFSDGECEHGPDTAGSVTSELLTCLITETAYNESSRLKLSALGLLLS